MYPSFAILPLHPPLPFPPSPSSPSLLTLPPHPPISPFPSTLPQPDAAF